MRKKILIALVAAAVVTAGAALGTSIASGAGDTEASGTDTQTSTPTTPAVDDANLELISHAAAARYGESEPTDLVDVTGSYNKAAIATLTGAVVEKADEGVVDVVQMHGDFTVPTTPYGQTPPTGHSLTVVVSRETGEATDIFMAEGDEPGPNLANLDRGQPTPLQ